jgi:cyclohexyl-isocyanide hydratase
VLARLPNTTTRIFAKTAAPVRDVRGLILTPDATFAEAPQLDVLHVPGGFGQEALMGDEESHAWLRSQAAGALRLFGLHRRADLRRHRTAAGTPGDDPLDGFPPVAVFGAIPVNERVVVDGNLVSAAGVTAGIDWALRVSANLRGDAGRTRRHAPGRAPVGREHHPAARGDGAPRRAASRHCNVT